MSHKFDLPLLTSKLRNTPEYMPYKMNINGSVDTFLKIRETLTRIGRLQNNTKNGKESLWQVCHIVQDDLGDCYILHFKHLYLLADADDTVFNEQDYAQMTYIASLLESWGLGSFDEKIDNVNTRCNISIIPYARKKDVILRKKFYIKRDSAV